MILPLLGLVVVIAVVVIYFIKSAKEETKDKGNPQ